jgi:hypothetical protein
MQFVIFLPEKMVHLKIFLKRFASDGLAGFHSISIAADTSSPPLTATNPRTFLPAADILCTSLSLPHAFHSHTHILLLPRPPPSPPRALPAPPPSQGRGTPPNHHSSLRRGCPCWGGLQWSWTKVWSDGNLSFITAYFHQREGMCMYLASTYE